MKYTSDFVTFLCLWLLLFLLEFAQAEIPQNKVMSVAVGKYSNGKLVFRNPLHEPRVYTGAPPGVHVTRVQAYEIQSSRKSVMYNLLDVRDHTYFSIDPTSGNISTAKNIDKKVGETYEIIAVAISQGETKLRQLQVTVTEYNEHSPAFEHEVYRGEVHVRSRPGYTVLRVRAVDPDPVPYNAEVYYALDPEDPRGRFILDPNTGVLTLAKPLEPKPEPLVEMGVIAVDGGSPKRADRARIEVLLKTISEPRDVRAVNATGTAVTICWTRPEYGHVLGYIIKYREVENPHGAPSFLNITSNTTTKCTTLAELKPWTDYEFRVYGWNRFETGQGSTVGRFGTRPDYCQMSICQNGECHVLNEEPGYHCDCETGYYGETCDKFDPCSLSPCENFGVCRNISHNKYRCDCLSGFSGQNCSEFNPCALRPSPCQNAGRCESTASHKYQCYCTKGYYGKTCQFFDPCSLEPCRNGGRCQNASQVDYLCKCVPGYTGKQCEVDVDECASSPCKHGGLCRDGVNTFHCRCAPGYRGKRCHLIEHCPAQTMATNRGTFRWNATAHGRAFLIECPFGSTFPERESATTGYAKRRCYLLSNGSVAWGRADLASCREEGFKNAEELTGELWMLTEDPKHLNVERLQEATRQIENVIEYAIYDKKIAHNMLSIISNMLAINETLLEAGDQNGTTTNRLTELVDRFVGEVRLERGESLILETENVAVKAVSWDPLGDPVVASDEDPLTFSVRYRKPRSLHKKGGKHRSPVPYYSPHLWTELMDEEVPTVYDDTELIIPFEAALMAQNQTYQELRIKFVAYKNDKFFRVRPSKWSESCWKKRRSPDCFPKISQYGFPGRRVLQASIFNVTITNLSDPVVYTIPSPRHVKVFCAYWKDQERIWSTEGLVTNQSDNSTTCFSNHLTSFSLLLDPTPYEGISVEHRLALSIISYIGCGLSIIGLVLTIITYSLFRCLNREHPGQILLHLCASMLLLNACFVAGSQRGRPSIGKDVCAAVAVLIHYFLLTTLSWMGVEAANMYQLLVHVFATAESHFMLKRCILAWGTPTLIVGVTVLHDWTVYHNQNEYCMLTATNPYVYYISFLGPSCLIIFINLTVFIMVTRVLFTPRNVSKAAAAACHKKDKFTVSTAQVRGAFSVMVLLGVSWVFGAFAVGEARLVFQYIFCVANSLQGFLIFIVRCLQYPEARSAWYQLFKTGTFKKYRGMVPPGSWSGTSNSMQNKQNGHSTSTRLGSLDAAANPVAFNSNFWSKSAPKDVLPHYEDAQQDNDVDFSTIRSSQMLTFSSSIKEEPKDETQYRKLSKHTCLRRSGSETLECKESDSFDTKFSFKLGPSVIVETSVNEDENSDIFLKDPANVKEMQAIVSPALTEPKNRGSYASTIGYIDEEMERKDKIAANILSSKTSNVYGHLKRDSPPDAEKLNSWPRTLSSFLGGKEVYKSSDSEKDFQNSLPKRFLTKPANSPQSECLDHTCQAIPLQVRPFSPSRSYTSDKRDIESPKSHIITSSTSGKSMTHSPLTTYSECNLIPESPENSIHDNDFFSAQNVVHTPIISGEHCVASFNTVKDKVSISGPSSYIYTPANKDNPNLIRDNICSQEEDTVSNQDTFQIWEKQGLVSPSKAMFIDSAASRL